jgi:hypothetical protein
MKSNENSNRAIDDPLSAIYDSIEGSYCESSQSQFISDYETISITAVDELRVIECLNKAAKKQAHGAIFTVKINFDESNALKLGVKVLTGNVLIVSMLKRHHGEKGPAEITGLRLGDIIFGANFNPLRDGSKSLLSQITRDLEQKKRSIHLQCWRCFQLCQEPAPGAVFPRIDELVVKAHFLCQTKVFNEWERWNFIGIHLR